MVFAASSLAEAFDQIASAYEEGHPGVAVHLNYAGSQRLRTQLEHGATADVFASADHIQMDRLMASGFLLGPAVQFTTNRLVVIVPKLNGTPSEKSSLARREREHHEPGSIYTLEDMAKQGVKLVMALPEVPAGTYARVVIANIGAVPGSSTDYAERVLANVVSMEPNVRSVAQKIALGEADAGIVYWSDGQVQALAGRVRVIPIPEDSNIIARYPVARLTGSVEPDLAEAFIHFLLSSQGQDILLEHGFGTKDASLGPPVGGPRRNDG